MALVITIIAGPAAPGCGSGDHRSGLMPVSGFVTVNGVPLTRGSIVFLPDRQGWIGRSPTGAITNGVFRCVGNFEPCEGVLIGKWTVQISATKEQPDRQDDDILYGKFPENLIPPKYNTHTILKAEVRADARNYFRFDLDIPDFEMP